MTFASRTPRTASVGTIRAVLFRLLFACLSAVMLVVCAGCSNGTNALSTTTTQVESTSLPRQTSTTIAEAPPTTVGPPELLAFETPRLAADALWEVWTSGDANRGIGIADAEEVQKMLAFPPGPKAKDRGCDSGEFDTAKCFFGNDQGGVNIELERTPAGWKVKYLDGY